MALAPGHAKLVADAKRLCIHNAPLCDHKCKTKGKSRKVGGILQQARQFAWQLTPTTSSRSSQRWTPKLWLRCTKSSCSRYVSATLPSLVFTCKEETRALLFAAFYMLDQCQDLLVCVCVCAAKAGLISAASGVVHHLLQTSQLNDRISATTACKAKAA